MKNEIPKQYNPKQVEDKWYKYWQDNNLFAAKPDKSKKPFCIVIPPPNITGILHMGHALNNTIQDILVRFHKLAGDESLWMPGTDHAGIATQNVVEKSIAKDGLKRQDLGREKFLERVWQWQAQYGSTIIHQLKKLGSSCDWPRTRFTMDEEYSMAVKKVFVSLWDKGLIYQDDKVINWCPRCQTALSDEEAPYNEMQGSLYYLKYPLKDSPEEFVVVATTRPETMLGDTAVAVNPKDKRYKKFIGKTLVLPLLNREIKIISDSIIDMKFGTGAVKVTPAHDPNDYNLGKKHNLEFINILNPDGVLNSNAGKFSGLDRFKARERVLEALKEQGLLEKIEPHQLSAGHCYRCHTIIEPYLSRQWFVKMKPLAKPAISAVKKGKIRFHPERWTKVYLNWMENIQDWCISRQIWWGHRIPLWYCLDCKKEPFASTTEPSKCPSCNSLNIKQDDDVLDTWFSSWLWPFATFYWPDKERSEKDLKYFYPTSVLVTAPEIIFFWVARMIMAGFELMKEIPFKDVYIHGTVRDIEGKKMSKSLGNVIDPLETIEAYGADALRFSLISITAAGQDVFLSKEKFEMGRNFANKVWNASRFILMNLGEEDNLNFKQDELNTQERWILSRLQSTVKNFCNCLENFEFNESAKVLYDFFWHEFCDWFIELSKNDILAGRAQTKAVLVRCMRDFLVLLHPIAPFITEEVWSILPGSSGSIMRSTLPVYDEKLIDLSAEKEMKTFISLVTRVRNLRQELSLDPSKLIEIIISADSKEQDFFDAGLLEKFKLLTKASSVVFKVKESRPAKAMADVEAGFNIYIPLAGVIDAEAQAKRLEKRVRELENSISNTTKQLLNKEFTRKAPKDIVDAAEGKLKADKNTLEKLKPIQNALKEIQS